MNELGHALREAREAQGLSLAEAEDRTRIRQKFIAAMEAEDWNALPGDVTTRGFLRKYATFLGLNPEEIVGLYQRRSSTSGPQPEVSSELSDRPVDYRPIELNLAEEPPRAIPWRAIAIVVVLLAIVAAGAWVYFYRPGWIANIVALPQNLPQPADVIALEPTTTPTTPELPNRVTATPTDTPEPAADATDVTPAATDGTVAAPTAESQAADDPQETPTPANADTIRLAINLIARSWIRLVIDGQVVTETVMEQGDTGSWEARESIVLRTGNAAGVKVNLNDEDLPFLGGPGEVIERHWDLVDGKIVETSPTAMPTPSPTETPAPETTDTPTP